MEDDTRILAPDGSEITSMDNDTSRSLERQKENSRYIPVIIKRNDESVKHPDDTLEKAIREGLEQHKRPVVSLMLSSVAAGLILGFAGMCVALMAQVFPADANPMIKRFAFALVYPLGFIICIMSGTQLFTEQTATAVYPVLDGKAKLKSLVSLWSTVLFGNLLGAFISSTLIYFAEPVIQAQAGFIEVATHITHFSFHEVTISSILAGWLMAQGGWLVLATPPASSQVICIYIVTFIIGFAGLHHSIAGAAEIFSGLYHTHSPEYNLSLITLLASIFGNLIGGSLFVGVLNYAHIKAHTKKKE